MEHGASERIKEQSHTEMPVKTEVHKAAQSTAYCEIQINTNFIKDEPGLVELVKSEPALLVKEEVVEHGSQDIAEQQCVQGPSTSAIVGSTNVFDSTVDLDNMLKEELGAIDIGPTVLQHMDDTWYTTNQKDVSVVKQERIINLDKTDPILCGGVKEEIIKAEWRGSPTPQDSWMEQPAKCTALHSLRKECLEMVCRVQLIRLDTFQCEVCDAAYIDAHKLLQHVQEVHGPGPKISLDRHAKSPETSNRPQQCATGSEPRICDYCKKMFTNKHGLQQHIAHVHSSVSYKCDQCNKIFKCKRYLIKHNALVHTAGSKPRIYGCDYCKKMFTNKWGVRQHIDNVHVSRSYKCDQCNKIFKCKGHLMTHTSRMHKAKVHTAADTDDQRSDKAAQSEQPELYSCDKCGKTYGCKQSLLRHSKNLHSTESHECTKCDMKFPSKHYLYMHTSNAHSEQQYECAVCKKICRSKIALYNHVYQVHRPRPAADTDARRSNEVSQSEQRARSQSCSCDKCGKSYASKLYLLRHYRNLHSTESHECTKCNKKFPSKLYLYNHTSTVHSEQQYECAVCKKICRSKRALYNHVYRVHPHRPAGSHQYTCTNCGRNFTSKWHGRQHEKSGKCTRPTASNTSAAASTSIQQPNVVIVKEEPADGELELGPVVFQHMDCNYRPYKLEPGLD